MKSNGNLRQAAESNGPEDTLHKATKLPPLKKSGKEKQSFYRELDDDDDLDLKSLHKRESVLDYFDDDEETDDEEIDEEEDWYDEDEEESGFEEDWDEGDEDWEE